MTTAIIGTGGIGSAIARLLASGGETLRLSSADPASARMLAADIGPGAAVAAGNGDALEGADAVVLALRFTVLQDVIGEVAGLLGQKLVVVPSNPLRTDEHGNVLRVLPDRGSLWPGGGRVAAERGTPGHGVREHVGRSPEVLEPSVARAGGPVLRNRRPPRRDGSGGTDRKGGIRSAEGWWVGPVGSPGGWWRPP